MNKPLREKISQPMEDIFMESVDNSLHCILSSS